MLRALLGGVLLLLATVPFPPLPTHLLRTKMDGIPQGHPKSALTESHWADSDRAERADVDRDRGHPTASMDSPWHKPPMSRATCELNRPSSTSPSSPFARTRGADPIVSGGPGRRGLAARVAGGSRGARPGDLAYIFIYSFEIDLTSLRHAHMSIFRRGVARSRGTPRRRGAFRALLKILDAKP